MAEDYSYPVLVELGETNTPRLKNKLVKYFQSRKSNGGDCVVDYESGSATVLLRFRREEGEFHKDSFMIQSSVKTCWIHPVFSLRPEKCPGQRDAPNQFGSGSVEDDSSPSFRGEKGPGEC